ncbi:PepSY-associated TM helix domain-containing protein [Rurimicrobium arvi]|uniref:PepSY-associated TM helix domain-containing protein n=1 Tax=Rurimicrobium arvi TaxID=2049916 RepID=A0ABP8MGD3_9BACT
MTFKKAIGKIHLWLGLSSGLVVFIVALTGCIYVFQKEITEAVHHDTYFVTVPASARPLPVSRLTKAAQAALGSGQPLNFFVAHRQPDRAWEFSAFKAGDPDALTYFSAIRYYRSVLINPYTAEVTGVVDHKYEFFNIVKYLHWSLLLNTPYGQPIVGIATLIFVIMLISGMILWWPKKWNKTNVNKSFRVKWSAGRKRVNYDLHNVSGFYGLLFTAILALTGLVWAFDWFQKLVYVSAALSTAAPENKEISSLDSGKVVTVNALDRSFHYADSLYPQADRIGVSMPFSGTAVYDISAYAGKEVYYHFDELRFDQYSGRLLYSKPYAAKNRGEKLIGMNYDIHVGAIWGLPGKIIAFVAGLIAAGLPVTGFLIWLGRRKKKKYVPYTK